MVKKNNFKTSNQVKNTLKCTIKGHLYKKETERARRARLDSDRNYLKEPARI